MTPAHCALMLAPAGGFEARLRQVIDDAAVPWPVTRLGARMELQFRTPPPQTAAPARAAMDEGVAAALHLWRRNRSLLITPFHSMLLVSPHTGLGDGERLASALREGIATVRA